MKSSADPIALRWCQLWLRCLSALVPARRRRDWYAEWWAELCCRHDQLERRGRSSAPGSDELDSPSLFASATGALPDALFLRTQSWSLDPMLNDLFFALRSLVKRPGFAAVAVVTLALGIGATTAIFSVVDAVLLRPLPYEEPERLVELWEKNPDRNWYQETVAPANFFDWQEQTHSFEGMAVYSEYTSLKVLGGAAEPDRARAVAVGGGFFDVLGVNAHLGRTFSEEETWTQENNVVISYGLWQRFFGGKSDVVGSTLEVNGVQANVLGVLPKDFQWHPEPVDVWHTHGWSRENREAVWFRRAHFVRAVARLKPGVGVDQAREDLEAVAARIEEKFPETNTNMGAGLTPLHTWVVGDTRTPLYILLGAVGLVLLIACANVANLLLARSTARLRELSVRSALGAGRWRLVRQLLTENMVLGLLASALGVAFAYFGIELLLYMSPVDIPRLVNVGLDQRVLSFAIAASIMTTLIFGLGPALIGSRAGVRSSSPTRSATSGREHSLVRSGLVVAEVALALVVVLATGLLGRSFLNLYQVQPGFDPDGLLVAQVSLPHAFYEDDEAINSFYDRLTKEVASHERVESVATTTVLPLEGQGWSADLSVEGQPFNDDGVEIRFAEVSADFFATMATPILQGRELTANDDAEASPVVVINESLKKQVFGDRDPLGVRIASVKKPTENTTWFTVVGVVADMNVFGLDEPPRPQVFFSLLQDTAANRELVLRVDGNPMEMTSFLRSKLKTLDPRLALMDVRTMGGVVASSVARQRFLFAQLLAFGAIALILAAVGTYGVLAYAVNQRAAEIGVRMAIGADRQEVLRLVLRQGMTLVGSGFLVGVVVAIAVTRLLESLLFGVHALDPGTLAITGAVLGVVGLLACYIPARKASRIDPAATLLAE